jgi:hypothetical protein
MAARPGTVFQSERISSFATGTTLFFFLFLTLFKNIDKNILPGGNLQLY